MFDDRDRTRLERMTVFSDAVFAIAIAFPPLSIADAL